MLVQSSVRSSQSLRPQPSSKPQWEALHPLSQIHIGECANICLPMDQRDRVRQIFRAASCSTKPKVSCFSLVRAQIAAGRMFLGRSLLSEPEIEKMSLASLASLATYHQLVVGTGDYKQSVVCNSNKPGFWRMGRVSQVIRGRRIICGLSSRAEIISVLS